MPVNHEIETFLADCSACGACQQACPFLEKYGLPGDILQSAGDTVFLCTNCMACASICPMNLSRAGAFFAAKTERIRSAALSGRVRQSLASAKAYAARGRSFPFSRLLKKAFLGSAESILGDVPTWIAPSFSILEPLRESFLTVHFATGVFQHPVSIWRPAKTVFWPGCGLTGANPDAASATRRHLADTLGEPVGLVVDCCFDPLYQLGDVDSARAVLDAIAARMHAGGIKRVITGCVNCTKLLRESMPGIVVEHALAVLPPGLFSSVGEETALHHPCPSARIPGLQEKAGACAGRVEEHSGVPSCCGCGGGLHVTEPALAAEFARKAMGTGIPVSLVTYCMGCKSSFQARGAAASHLLEHLPGVQPAVGPVSSGKKWLNRLTLGLKAKVLNPKVLLAIGLLLFIALTTWLRQQGYISMDGIIVFLREHPVLAPILFMLIYAVGPSIFLPSLPLTLGAGFLWGPFWGVIFSITGATTGASVAFLFARYVLRDAVKSRYGYERWQTLSAKVEQHGWKAVAFARLVPIFPFPVLNYFFGITPIPFFHYVWSTFVFMLPACIAYVAFGSSMGELILHGNIKGLLIGILVASFALLIPLMLKKIMHRYSGEVDRKES